MEIVGKTKVAKSCTEQYKCIMCDYLTSRKSSYIKHLLTIKHIRTTKTTMTTTCSHYCECGKSYSNRQNLYRHKKLCNIIKNTIPKVAKVANCFQMFTISGEYYKCLCGTLYKSRSGLWKHQKNCITAIKYQQEANEETNEEIVEESKGEIKEVSNEQVLEMLGSLKEDNDMLNAKLDQTSEDNKMLKKELHQLRSGVMTAVNEPKIINNNIIVLLNEKCGEAVAIKDFASQIAMGIEDVDYAMEYGKIKGIENIIRKKFEELGTFKRPLHCTDVKRGTLYVKNEEGWEKDKGQINKMIRDVECVQTKGITVWSEANPEYSEGNTKLMDKWLRIVRCLTSTIEEVSMRKIEKRCQEMSKLKQHDM